MGAIDGGLVKLMWFPTTPPLSEEVGGGETVDSTVLALIPALPHPTLEQNPLLELDTTPSMYVSTVLARSYHNHLCISSLVPYKCPVNIP